VTSPAVPMVKDATAHLPRRASVANGWPVIGTRPGEGTTIGRPALTRVEQFTAGLAVRWAAPEHPPIPASSRTDTSTAARRRRQDAAATGVHPHLPGAVPDRLRHPANASRPGGTAGAETESCP
jgi:hypothetical protein